MKKRNRALVLGLVVLAAVAVYAFWGKGLSSLNTKPPPAQKSSDLRRTQIVATLDTPIEKGKNAIWCVSFQAAWKTLQNDLAKEPVSLEGNGRLVDSLNQAYTPGREVPEGSLYTAAGFKDKGILEKIRQDLKAKFPAKDPPTFPGIIKGSFVAYSYLEANVTFTLPYLQNKKPLQFMDSSRKNAPTASFGVREEDASAHRNLRDQPLVLYEERNDPDQSAVPECIIDLDGASQPSQIILALVEREDTLADTLSSVEKKIASMHSYKGAVHGLGINDVLLVPDVSWQITHRFAELEGRRFGNAALKGQGLDVAQQDTLFRLDRSGAELRSEAKAYAMSGPAYYVFDRPFLIIMKKRGAKRPYFVMWVDNAELLRRMPPT